MAIPTKSGKTLALAVTSHLSVNGLILPTLQALQDAGWTIHVICAPGPVDSQVRKHAKVEFIPMERSVSPARDGLALARMTRLLRDIHPDVLVGSTPKAAMISMLAGRLARVPVRVFQMRGARWDRLEGRLRRILLAADRFTVMNATDVLSVSNSLSDLMVSAGVCRYRPLVLGSGGSKGVDPSIFWAGNDREYDPRAPRLGFVGRLAVDKGIDDALAVFASIRKREPLASMTVVGELDESQPVSPRTMNLLRMQCVSGAIMWKRSLPSREVADRMREMDLLVFPSVREGLPNVVIEAAACGVPAVGWDVTGTRDAVVHGETGFLVRVGDRNALADLAQSALTSDCHRQLRDGAIRFAQTEFTSEVVQAEFERYLDARLSASSRGSP